MKSGLSLLLLKTFIFSLDFIPCQFNVGRGWGLSKKWTFIQRGLLKLYVIKYSCMMGAHSEILASCEDIINVQCPIKEFLY